MCRVLIVEDELLVALALEMALSDGDHEVVGTATTADEAVEMAMRSEPDVMIVDLRLADGSSGAEAVARLRATHDMPVIFASGNLDPATRADLERLSPAAMISKPYDEARIVEIVEKTNR